MFDGQRLSYVVPGYAGHIPNKVIEDFVPLHKREPTSKIPGYAGYVPSIKPENIYANTFGKITYQVSNQEFPKGQDLDPKQKFVSTQHKTNVAPSEMLQRTAADIVGVPNVRIDVNEPLNTKSTYNQFTVGRSEDFRKSLGKNDTKWTTTNVSMKDGKEYIELGNPLPGYTGFGKRILANNIFGKTFAECRNESLNDEKRLNHEKRKNFNEQLNAQPPLKP